MAYEHSEGWGAASTKIVISGGFGAGKTSRPTLLGWPKQVRPTTTPANSG